MSKKSSPTLQGHIILRTQKGDQKQSGVVVVSNTPLEDLDGQPNSNISPNKSEPAHKKTNSRILIQVDKSAQKRTTRTPSAKSGVSGSGQKLPDSAKEEYQSPIPNQEGGTSSPGETEKMFEKDDADEHSKSQDIIALEGRLDLYRDDEERLICYRFPHLKFCVCGVDYDQVKSEPPVEVYPGIFIANLNQSLISKNLLKLGITHILNLSTVEYTKRYHYFEYLNLDIFDNHEEDIKKCFRITNRFITEALQSGGKVLVHSLNSRSRAPAFISGYLIGKVKKTLKRSLEIISESWPDTEVNNYFYQQLEQYDLEKLAIGSNIKL